MRFYWYVFRKDNGVCISKMKGRVGPCEDSMNTSGYFAVKSNVDLGKPREIMFVDGEIKQVIKI